MFCDVDRMLSNLVDSPSTRIVFHTLPEDPYAKFCQDIEKYLDILLKSPYSGQDKNARSEQDIVIGCRFHDHAINHFDDL